MRPGAIIPLIKDAGVLRYNADPGGSSGLIEGRRRYTSEQLDVGNLSPGYSIGTRHFAAPDLCMRLSLTLREARATPTPRSFPSIFLLSLDGMTGESSLR